VTEYERGREDGAAEYAASMDAERAGWARRTAELEAALREFTRHHGCEDCFYSCPQHPEYCGPDGSSTCDCGADRASAALAGSTVLRDFVRPLLVKAVRAGMSVERLPLSERVWVSNVTDVMIETNREVDRVLKEAGL